MKKNIGYFEKRKALIVILAITLSLCFFELYLVQIYKNNQLSENQNIIEFYEDEYITIINGYSSHARTYYNESINKDEVIDIIALANNSNEDIKDSLRLQLSEMLEDTYSSIKEDNFRQLHFVLKDCTSFLRMHSPDNYGDNLRGVRKTVEIVADTQNYVEGFEEGRIYNGYRFEYPLFKDEEYIGCVEISMSYSSIFELMDSVFDSPGLFIMEKEVVNNKVWEQERELYYLDCSFSDQYYFDKEIYNYFVGNDKYNEISNWFLSNTEKVSDLESKLENEETFVINDDFDNTNYSIIFLKVEDVTEDNVGYLVFLRQTEIYTILVNSIKFRSTTVIILWLILIFIVIKYYKYKLERDKITYYDQLTGALNRNSLFDQLNYQIETYKRYNTKFSIMMFDLDKFKQVNDIKGHSAGDRVLKMVAGIAKDNIRTTDKIYRYGGDEFLIILPNTEMESAIIVAEKIRKIVDETEFVINNEINVTLSIGVLECAIDSVVDNMLIKVDQLLYKAKEAGRNKIAWK